MTLSRTQGFLMLVPAILIALVSILGGTVAAAQVALPGSPLYGVKTATEEIRLAIARTDATKAKTHLSIAAEKLNELKRLPSDHTSADVVKKVQAAFEAHQEKADTHIKNVAKESQTHNLEKKFDENKKTDETVLADLYTKVPEKAKEAIEAILLRKEMDATTTKKHSENSASSSNDVEMNATTTRNGKDSDPNASIKVDR